MDQHADTEPAARPSDARKPTEEQRRRHQQLEHQDEDLDAPGLHQSRHDVPDESTR